MDNFTLCNFFFIPALDGGLSPESAKHKFPLLSCSPLSILADLNSS